MLQRLALKMHEGQLKEVAAEELQRWLTALFLEVTQDQRAAERAVERFLRVIEERTGLLTARGEGVYAFSHLTFQEYLAALAIATRDDYAAYTLPHVREAWWREVILLEAGYFSTQGPERTTRLIRAIADLKAEPAPYHNLVLAAECLRDVGEGRVSGNLAADVLKRLRADLDLNLQQEIERRQPRSGWDTLKRRVQGQREFDKADVIREIIQRKSVATWADETRPPDGQFCAHRRCHFCSSRFVQKGGSPNLTTRIMGFSILFWHSSMASAKPTDRTKTDTIGRGYLTLDSSAQFRTQAYERKYGVTSQDFYELYRQGGLDDEGFERSTEFARWASAYEMQTERETEFEAQSRAFVTGLQQDTAARAVRLQPNPQLAHA